MQKPKYKTPTAKFIKFDNRDIIIASPRDLPCTSRYNGKAYCLSDGAGDSTQPNQCDYPNGYYCSGVLSLLPIHNCTADQNEYFVNSVGPIDI